MDMERLSNISHSSPALSLFNDKAYHLGFFMLIYDVIDVTMAMPFLKFSSLLLRVDLNPCYAPAAECASPNTGFCKYT